MSVLGEKNVLVIGDSTLCLIGVAGGADIYIFKNDCDSLGEYLSKNIDKYGVYIVSRDVYEKCVVVKNTLDQANALTIVIDPPKALEKIDPKKYYEELIVKFVGMKVSL